MNFDRLRSTLNSGGEHLGDMIFWALADARIDRVTLEAVWMGAGLDMGLLPDPPTAEKALKVAVREAQVGHPNLLVRLAKEDESEIVFGVVREKRLGDGSLAYAQEARVRLDRASESLSTDEPGHELAAAIRTGFDVLRTTHTADDVRRAIVKTLGAFAAVTLREGGGVYYVPSPYSAQLRQLQHAVEQIGTSKVYLLPVHKSADAQRTLGEIAKGAIETELAALTAEIDGFVQAPPERPSTLVRRFDAFEALRSRARLYREVLAVEVQNLDSQLDKLSGAVEGMLSAKQQAA